MSISIVFVIYLRFRVKSTTWKKPKSRPFWFSFFFPRFQEKSSSTLTPLCIHYYFCIFLCKGPIMRRHSASNCQGRCQRPTGPRPTGPPRPPSFPQLVASTTTVPRSPITFASSSTSSRKPNSRVVDATSARPLYIGMQLIITSNVCTVLGVANGAPCTLVAFLVTHDCGRVSRRARPFHRSSLSR